ncbi:MAG TPA: hypothetical protein VNU71_02280 [Burkholderiaceae bacterium]|nr:hypothetical protein [Burkholderiaceae bacterium]
MQSIPVGPLLPVPWYRVGVMWVFVGGLGAVVIGSFMLLATAITHADKVLPSTPMKPPSYFKAAAADASKPAP